jgi:hypothetical protein
MAIILVGGGRAQLPPPLPGPACSWRPAPLRTPGRPVCALSHPARHRRSRCAANPPLRRTQAAYHPRLLLLGISTVAGNQSVEKVRPLHQGPPATACGSRRLARRAIAPGAAAKGRGPRSLLHVRRSGRAPPRRPLSDPAVARPLAAAGAGAQPHSPPLAGHPGVPRTRRSPATP